MQRLTPLKLLALLLTFVLLAQCLSGLAQWRQLWQVMERVEPSPVVQTGTLKRHLHQAVNSTSSQQTQVMALCCERPNSLPPVFELPLLPILLLIILLSQSLQRRHMHLPRAAYCYGYRLHLIFCCWRN